MIRWSSSITTQLQRQPRTLTCTDKPEGRRPRDTGTMTVCILMRRDGEKATPLADSGSGCPMSPWSKFEWPQYDRGINVDRRLTRQLFVYMIARFHVAWRSEFNLDHPHDKQQAQTCVTSNHCFCSVSTISILYMVYILHKTSNLLYFKLSELEFKLFKPAAAVNYPASRN